MSVRSRIGSDAVVGTAGDDTITGARVDTLGTWNSADTIAAGAGTDTLTATITGNITPADGAITGVENLVVTNLSGGAATITFSTSSSTGISGVTSITNMGSTLGNDLVLTRVADLASITLNNTVGDTTVTFADALLAGSADTVTLNVDGNTGAVDIGNSSAGGAGIETLVINATGAKSTFSAATIDAAVTSVTITGSADLDINGAAAFAKLSTLDASTATGDIDVLLLADDVTGTTNTKTVTTGAGSDEVSIVNLVATTVGAVSVNLGAGNDTLTVGTIAADYTLDGGAGTGDRLIASAAITSAIGGGVKNFERFELAETSATQDMLAIGNGDNVNTFTVVTAGAATTTINNIAASVTTLEIKGGAATAAATFGLRVDNATGDTITVKATTATAALTGDLGVNDFEAITFDTSDYSLDVQGDITSADLDAITLVGDNAIALGTATTKEFSSTTLATIDATGITGSATAEVYAINSTANMTVTGPASTGAFTVHTGSGNDTITAGAGAATVVAGVGNDTINGGAAALTVTGGSGSDTIVLVSSSVADTIVYAGTDLTALKVEIGNNSIYDTISGFESGSDTISFDVVAVTASTTGTGEFTSLATGTLVTDAFNELTPSLLAGGYDGASSADVASYLAANSFTAATTVDVLLSVSDGTDTFVYLYEGGLGDTEVTITADDLLFVAKLTGVDDLVAGDVTFVA